MKSCPIMKSIYTDKTSMQKKNHKKAASKSKGSLTDVYSYL